MALVKVALRQREQLATLRVRDGVFVLETMLWPDEVRKPDFGFLDEDISVRPQELAMAGSLIETLAGDFDPTPVHRRLPRGAAGGHRREGRRPRGGVAGRAGGRPAAPCST